MNLSTNIDFDIKQYFVWWGRELSYWIPEKYRKALSDKSGFVFLSINNEKLAFSHIQDGQQQLLAEINITENSQDQYKQLTSKNEALEQSRFILRLNSNQAIKKILYLPAAVKENIRQVVAFEMDRYTPFKEDQVHFSVQILEQENGQLKVLLVYTPKDKLDKLCQQLKTINIYPTLVDYDQAANILTDGKEPYTLLPGNDGPVKNKFTRYSINFLCFLLLLLISAVFVFPVWHEGQTVNALRKQLKELESDSRLVQSQQLEIDQLIDETSQLIQAKKNAPSMTEITNTLSQLLSDNTWLTHLKFKNAQLQIQGQSPAASTLIGTLEGSSFFSNARFVSPLTQDKRTGMERFQISVDVAIKDNNND